MENTFIEKFLCYIQNKIKIPLADYPKYPNKLQVSAIILFFKSFPLLPKSPIYWDPKKRGLGYRTDKTTIAKYLAWVFVFDFVCGIIMPCVLLWFEFGPKSDSNPHKMGMTTSAFQILYLCIILAIGFAIFLWSSKAQEVSYDYVIIGKFTNYLDQVLTWENPRHLSSKMKIDMMGIATQMNCQGNVASAYIAPILILYFKVDPMWGFLRLIFPSCVSDANHLTHDLSCQIWFYGIRPGFIFCWFSSGAFTIGGTVLFAWIFFEMFNQCTAKLKALKPETGIHLYWAYWKVYAGTKYWSKVSLAIGIYGGIWLVTISLYATITLVPNAKPLTFVYATFPLCGSVAMFAFMCFPRALEFPLASAGLIDKWRHYAGENSGSFEGRVLRRQVRAMQPSTIKVGEFFNLDKEIVVIVTTAVVDETVNLIMSLSSI